MTLLAWLLGIGLEIVLLYSLACWITRVESAETRLKQVRPQWRTRLKALNQQVLGFHQQIISAERNANTAWRQLPVTLSLLWLKPGPLQLLLLQGIRRLVRIV